MNTTRYRPFQIWKIFITLLLVWLCHARPAFAADIYAVVDYPFTTVISALNDLALGQANWCVRNTCR